MVDFNKSDLTEKTTLLEKGWHQVFFFCPATGEYLKVLIGSAKGKTRQYLYSHDIIGFAGGAAPIEYPAEIGTNGRVQLNTTNPLMNMGVMLEVWSDGHEQLSANMAIQYHGYMGRRKVDAYMQTESMDN